MPLQTLIIDCIRMSQHVDEMTKAFEALTISDGPLPPEQWVVEPGLPKRWEDDPKDPDGVKDRFLEDWGKVREYYKSENVRCFDVTTDAEGVKRFQPTIWASLQLAGYPPLKHELDAEFILLHRKVDLEHPQPKVSGQVVLRHVEDKKLVDVEMVIVDKKRLPGLEAQGWGV